MVAASCKTKDGSWIGPWIENSIGPGGGGGVVNDGCLFLRHRGLAPVAILCLSMSNKTVLAISDV